MTDRDVQDAADRLMAAVELHGLYVAGSDVSDDLDDQMYEDIDTVTRALVLAWAEADGLREALKEAEYKLFQCNVGHGTADHQGYLCDLIGEARLAIIEALRARAALAGGRADGGASFKAENMCSNCERLRVALRRYGSHQRAYCGDPPINRCLCGLDATLAGRTVSSQPPETSSR
jgi:hypothetical protein